MVGGGAIVMSRTAPPLDEVQRREQEFHDALSSPLKATEMPPRAPDRLETALLRLAGDVKGLRVLDLGCGAGELTLWLAARGALVTALDLSPGMVAIARERTERFRPAADAHFVVAAVEHSGLDAESFDLVIGKWILHHAEVAGAAMEIRRLLRSGGRGLFAENSALNPVLSYARRHLAGRWGIPLYGTRDEHPLTSNDFATFGQVFALTRLHFPDFFFFQLFDRQILKFRNPSLTRVLRRLDLTVETMPRLRRYSYHVIVELRRWRSR
jgi:SAM-dependent methyltransferase